jgi:hypothetical protein
MSETFGAKRGKWLDQVHNDPEMTGDFCRVMYAVSRCLNPKAKELTTGPGDPYLVELAHVSRITVRRAIAKASERGHIAVKAASGRTPRQIMLLLSAQFELLKGQIEHPKPDLSAQFEHHEPDLSAQMSAQIGAHPVRGLSVESKGCADDSQNSQDSQRKKDSLRADARLCEDFERFWQAYPKREGANPKAPARKRFLALQKAGEPVDAIVAAARRYADKEHDRVGTRFIAQAVTWLNQRRWEDYPEPATQTENGKAGAGFYAEFGSAELDAWDAYGRMTKGQSYPRDKRGGWWFDDRWPPVRVANVV